MSLEKGIHTKVAAVQLSSDENKEKNISRAVELVQEAIAHEAEFIVLPETFDYRGGSKDSSSVAEEIPGQSLLPLIELARQHRVWILAGSIHERTTSCARPYNTSVLIDDAGQLKARYRKIHLFDISLEDKVILESERYAAGEEVVTASIDGIKVGLTICYDLRFPELYRELSERGVELVTVPSSFTSVTGEAHWEVLVRARAIENQCFVVAPNQSGIGAGSVATFGNSMIVDPWGTVLARASEHGEEVVYADLDFDMLTQVRKGLPALQHKRLLRKSPKVHFRENC